MRNGESGRDGMPVEEHLPGAVGSSAVNDHMARLATTMREMEQGMRPSATLDSQASPIAARRIRQQLHLNLQSHHGKVRRTMPTQVLTCSSSHPSAGVAEGVVVTRCENVIRTYSIRLEEEDGHWWIVELASPDIMRRAAVTTASRTGSVPIGPDGRRRSSGRATGDAGPKQAPPRGRGPKQRGPGKHDSRNYGPKDPEPKDPEPKDLGPELDGPQARGPEIG